MNHLNRVTFPILFLLSPWPFHRQDDQVLLDLACILPEHRTSTGRPFVPSTNHVPGDSVPDQQSDHLSVFHRPATTRSDDSSDPRLNPTLAAERSPKSHLLSVQVTLQPRFPQASSHLWRLRFSPLFQFC